MFINKSIKTGELYFKANLSDEVDNHFYIYFSNYNAPIVGKTDAIGANNVWTNDYELVSHFHGRVEGFDFDSTGGYAASFSTGNANMIYDTTGAIGLGIGFDSSISYIALSKNSSMGVTGRDFTLSAFVKPDSSSSQVGTVFNWGHGTGTGVRRALGYYGKTEIEFTANNGRQVQSKITSTDWNLFQTKCYDIGSNNATCEMWTNGVIKQALMGYMPNTSANFPEVAVNRNYQEAFQGSVDELRLSRITRSSHWMTAEANNLLSPSEFYSIGEITTNQN